MGYGLRVKDNSGDVVLDISNEVTRFRHSQAVSADASGNVDLTDIDGMNSVEFSVMTQTIYNYAPHSVSRSGTVISWAPNSGAIYSSANSLIFLFLYN